MKLETQRLFLTNLNETFLQDFYEIFNSDKVNVFVNKMNYEQVVKYFDKIKNNPPKPYSFAVILKENNKMIGTIEIKEKQPKIGTVSYVFNDKFWGNGYCSESLDFLIMNAFKNWDFEKLLADCQEDNISSKKVLTKCGFKFSHTVKEQQISHYTNKLVGFDYFELTKKDYIK